MVSERTFQRITAVTAVLSAPLALGASIMLVMTIADVDIIANPARMIALGERTASIFRLVEFTGMFGYYLLLLPAAIYLWAKLRPVNPRLVDLLTVLGLFSLAVGSIGSTLLFSVLPPMMSAYSQAAEAQRMVLTAVFQAVMDGAVSGLLAVSSILGGLWWMGIGLLFLQERRAFGIATAALGFVSLLYGAGENLNVTFLTNLEPLTFFAPIWALWLGILIWRSPVRGEAGVNLAKQG